MSSVLGFTQIELLLTLGLAALAAGMATPTLASLYADGCLSRHVNTLADTLQLARSEAVRRQQPVYACPIRARNDLSYQGCRNDADWSDGILLYVDSPTGSSARYDAGEAIARVILHAPGSPRRISISGPGVLSFTPYGQTTLSSLTALHFQDSSGQCRTLQLSPWGSITACGQQGTATCPSCP